jgi:hypothetical protein
LLASFGLFWFSDTVADPDIWGHVRFGQDILRTGSIVQEDTYSYRTAGQPWIDHEWLSEVIFAGLYDRAGPRGLIVFKVLISLLVLGLCSASLHRRGLGPYGSALLLIVICIPFRLGLGTIRPQMFTYLLFALQLLLIEGAGRGRESGLWALPILFAVWVNLHGGVLAGVGVLILWIAARVVERLRDPTGPPSRRLGAFVRLGLLGAACGCALLLNPYGAGLVRFLLHTATVPRPEVGEWTPLGLISLPGQFYLGLLAIGILGLAGSSRRRRPEIVLIFGAAALLPLIAYRHYPLFALTLVILGGEHIADAADRWRLPRRSGSSPSRRGLAALSLLASLLLLALAPPRLACIRVEPYDFPCPARAVVLLKQSGLRGNLAVPYDWGEYALWHLGPQIKVSMDGRRETAYSDAEYRRSRDFEQGTGVWDALLKAEPSTDLVLAPSASPTTNLLSRTRGWLPVHQDTLCTLFVRAGFPGLSRIVQTPVPSLPDDGAGLCFPGPSRAHRSVARPGDRRPEAPLPPGRISTRRPGLRTLVYPRNTWRRDHETQRDLSTKHTKNSEKMIF